MSKKVNAAAVMAKKAYNSGLAKANRGVDALVRIFGGRAPKVAEMAHDAADKNMYHAIASGSSAEAQFNRGQAMGYGMYAHTGKKLKPK
jgi:hypothetical protein